MNYKPSPKPLPCPFCGGEPYAIHTGESVEMTVYCPHCGGSGPECERLVDAINAWNRRTEVPR